MDARTGMLREGDRLTILTDVQGQLAEFTKLVGDLVQLARDDGEATPEALDFRHVVTAALERARRRGPGLDFDVELDPFYVVGVPDALERAVTNLLDNAVKWSPPGGTSASSSRATGCASPTRGPGIAEEDLPRVFDRFFRADTARTTPGTGPRPVDRRPGRPPARRGRPGRAGPPRAAPSSRSCCPGARSLEALPQPAPA